MSDQVTVTYVNENKDAGGGPYQVTIADKYGKSKHKVTGKTIRRNGSFQATVQKLIDARWEKIKAGKIK
jgi:hypothetical protein